MHVLPLAFGLSVAALTVWRWGGLGWPARAAAATLCGVLFVYGTGVVHLPEPQALVDTLGLTLGPYTYVLVGVMAFLETAALVGLIVPGETLVIVGGVVAGQGHLDVVALIALTWACALCGDLSGYALGRRLGRPFLLEHGPRLHITEPRLIRVESWFARHGLATILVGRFVGLVRPLAPFLAGASSYPGGRFAAVALVGTALWSAACVVLGFLLWQSFDQAIAIAQQGTLALALAALLVAVALMAHRRLRAAKR